MSVHLFRRASTAPLTDLDRSAIRGAVRGVWGPVGPRRPRVLVVPGSTLNELSELLPELRHDPALQEACVRVELRDRGAAIVLDLRADLSAAWVDRVEAPVVDTRTPAERLTQERARDRGRSQPARAAALSAPGPKWRKAQR